MFTHSVEIQSLRKINMQILDFYRNKVCKRKVLKGKKPNVVISIVNLLAFSEKKSSNGEINKIPVDWCKAFTL